MSGDLPEEVQGIRLVAPFLIRTGELQRALRLGPRLVQPAREAIRLAQPDIKVRVRAPHASPCTAE